MAVLFFLFSCTTCNIQARLINSLNNYSLPQSSVYHPQPPAHSTLHLPTAQCYPQQHLAIVTNIVAIQNTAAFNDHHHSTLRFHNYLAINFFTSSPESLVSYIKKLNNAHKFLPVYKFFSSYFETVAAASF